MMAGVKELKKKDGMIDHSKDWTNTGSFVNKPSKGWLHPNEQLHPDAGVSYGVRYVGCMEVLESMKSLNFETRTQVAKESINMIAEAAGLKGRQSKKSSKIRSLLGSEPLALFSNCNVTITITTSAIDIVADTGEMVAHHEMPGISFASGGEEDTQDFVAYVAKDEIFRRSCHVLECGQQLAQDVITTIGQAFELRFKMFLAEQQHIGRNVMRVEPAQFEKNSNNWGNDDEYYNDRPDAKPPTPPPADVRLLPPHPSAAIEYSIPSNNTPIKGGSAVYSSVKSHRDSNLIDFTTDTSSFNPLTAQRMEENRANYDTPRPLGETSSHLDDLSRSTTSVDKSVPVSNGTQSRGYQNVTLSQPPPPLSQPSQPPIFPPPKVPTSVSTFPPPPIIPASAGIPTVSTNSMPSSAGNSSLQSSAPVAVPSLTTPRPQPQSISPRSQPINNTTLQMQQPINHPPPPVGYNTQSASHPVQPMGYNTQPVIHSTQPVGYNTQPVSHSAQPMGYNTQPVSHPAQPMGFNTQPANHVQPTNHVSSVQVSQAPSLSQGGDDSFPPPPPPSQLANLNNHNTNTFDMMPICRTLPKGGLQMPPQMPDIQVLPYNESWFHGKISRQRCEELLKENGQFLVRESANSPGQFVLSGCQNGTVRHLLLVDPNGVVRTKDRTFTSIAHLIDYHVKNRLPISSNDTELELRVPLTVNRPMK